ncbi:MAG: helix-turn-helix transcriptional regulator [Clostridia bacterium]|nr:helix-turn-helix transcriptional regulator [Clostridia bacterium]
MEFNEKLQELRKQKGLTQEELAGFLYVSRTAVSKWESGRGYPNIDSLKAIAGFFSVTVDELLSGEEVLNIAEEDTRQREKKFVALVFGLLDISVAMLLFMPLFGQKTHDMISGVSLLALTEIAPYLRIAYFVFVGFIALWGILILAMQNFGQNIVSRSGIKISLIVNAGGELLFIISSQPYTATLLFVFLVIKVLLLIKKL